MNACVTVIVFLQIFRKLGIKCFPGVKLFPKSHGISVDILGFLEAETASFIPQPLTGDRNRMLKAFGGTAKEEQKRDVFDGNVDIEKFWGEALSPL